MTDDKLIIDALLRELRYTKSLLEISEIKQLKYNAISSYLAISIPLNQYIEICENAKNNFDRSSTSPEAVDLVLKHFEREAESEQL